MLAEVERELLSHREAPPEALFERARAIARVLSVLPDTPVPIRERATALEGLGYGEVLRGIDVLRHGLLHEGGQAIADWDLIDPETGLALKPRRPFPGIRAYFEDIRSPFNVGSMLRSAEAFGLEEVLLSEDSADPSHPRALRSAMGAERLLPWRRSDLSCLADYGPAFALELGGPSIDEFPLPPRGIVVLGSEELGVSAKALDLCALGKVSIPMRGAKASINVGVAFGVLLQAWTSRLGL